MEYIIVWMSIYESEYKKIANKIKTSRMKCNLSQKDLADKLGTTQSHVSKIEAGQLKIDLILLKKISTIIRLDINELL